MIPPEEPREEDCCNNGCNPCIFDVYEKKQKLYKKYILENADVKKLNENLISDTHYTTFTVIYVKHLNECHKMLFLKYFLQINQPHIHLHWNSGQYFLLKLEKSSKTLTRAYTPLRLKDDEDVREYDFAIIVKLYQGGVASEYLFSMKIGDNTLWRGPYGDYEYMANSYERILMLAQGTGIAPFYSIIEQLLENEDDMTRIHLFFCCHKLNSVLLRKELYSLSSNWNFTYKVFVSSESENKDLFYKEPIEFSKMNFNSIQQELKDLNNTQIMLCGSQDFIASYKQEMLKYGIDDNKLILF